VAIAEMAAKEHNDHRDSKIKGFLCVPGDLPGQSRGFAISSRIFIPVGRELVADAPG
jgi:hypothetical protein